MMEPFAREYLIAVARAYAAAQDLSLSTIGRQFHGDDRFFMEFEKGIVTVTLRKYDQMLSQFFDNWPNGIQWPNGGTIKLKKSWVKKS